MYNCSFVGIRMEITFGGEISPVQLWMCLVTVWLWAVPVDLFFSGCCEGQWSGGSVCTVRLWHGPQLVWKGRLATDSFHWYALWFGVRVGVLVLGLVGFSLSDIYLVFTHLFFLSKYLACLMCKDMEIVNFSHCKIVSKQTNSRVYQFILILVWHNP